LLTALALAVEEVIKNKTARAPGLVATIPASPVLALAPSGALRLEDSADHVGQIGESTVKRIRQAFHRGQGHGLVQLGAVELTNTLPPTLAFWRDFGRLFVSKLCGMPELEEERETFTLPVPDEQFSQLLATAPPMRGGEYLRVEVLEHLWSALEEACRVELRECGETVQGFLQAKNPVWTLVGRVHFHLAEQKGNRDARKRQRKRGTTARPAAAR